MFTEISAVFELNLVFIIKNATSNMDKNPPSLQSSTFKTTS